MHRKIPLPRGWNRQAKSAILHILALSHYTPNLFESTTNMPFLAHQESVDQYTTSLLYRSRLTNLRSRKKGQPRGTWLPSE